MKRRYVKFNKPKSEPLTINNMGRIQATANGVHIHVERKKLDSLSIDDKSNLIKEIKDKGILLHITDN